MTLFPFFEDIENKNILIVGGGKVACEKYDKLKMFTNRIKVVAQETQLSGEFVYKKSFEDSDLEDIDICIVATSDRELNRNIASLCNAKAIKVNVVDHKELCSFIFPSLVKKGNLCIGISTSGSSPIYSKPLREQIEQCIPDDIEMVLDRMEGLRKKVPEEVSKQSDRAKLYKKLLLKLLDGTACSDEELIHELLEK